MHPGGGCPAAAETFDRRYVLWARDGALYAAQFLNGTVSTPRRVGEMPTLFDGDRLRGLQAGSDGARLYAFWNITRANGNDETWFTSGAPGADTWQPPRRLTVAPEVGTSFETTFNTGRTAVAASERVDGMAAAWAAPLRTPNAPLPVAVQVNREALGVVYLQAGEVVGWQRVVSTSPLLGAPELQTDRDRHLYLAWSAPLDIGTAQMQVTATRRLSEN
jgi:hypothetical protein